MATTRDDITDDRGRFSGWYPAADALQYTPRAPGVFQVRKQRGLLAYPQGKSAMIRYGHAVDMRAALEREMAHWRTNPAHTKWLCRHQVVDDEAAAKALYQQVLGRFVTRFGSPPQVPSPPLSDSLVEIEAEHSTREGAYE